MQCAITEESFSEEYSAIVESMGIFDPQTGQSCSLSEDDYARTWTDLTGMDLPGRKYKIHI